jgi:hypothetical protein
MEEYQDTITEQELIDLAIATDGGVFDDTDTAERAIERLYCNGQFDDVVGIEGSEPESAVLYLNWILWTDSQGNNSAEEFASTEDSNSKFEDYLNECYDQV